MEKKLLTKFIHSLFRKKRKRKSSAISNRWKFPEPDRGLCYLTSPSAALWSLQRPLGARLPLPPLPGELGALDGPTRPGKEGRGLRTEKTATELSWCAESRIGCAGNPREAERPRQELICASSEGTKRKASTETSLGLRRNNA